MQSPAPVSVTVTPSTVHAPIEAKVTVNPEDAAATRSNGASPTTRSGNVAKSIAWTAPATSAGDTWSSATTVPRPNWPLPS